MAKAKRGMKQQTLEATFGEWNFIHVPVSTHDHDQPTYATKFRPLDREVEAAGRRQRGYPLYR